MRKKQERAVSDKSERERESEKWIGSKNNEKSAFNHFLFAVKMS